MKLYALEPEVAGECGPATIIRNQPDIHAGRATVPDVEFLEYHFWVWLRDDLLQCEACYVVTEILWHALVEAEITGIASTTVEITTTDDFMMLEPELGLPAFRRLLPQGKVDMNCQSQVISWSGDDVCWGTRTDWVKPARVEDTFTNPSPFSLVVSERCFEVLKRHKLEHCDIEELSA